jgi:hypothetical protein
VLVELTEKCFSTPATLLLVRTVDIIMGLYLNIKKVYSHKICKMQVTWFGSGTLQTCKIVPLMMSEMLLWPYLLLC